MSDIEDIFRDVKEEGFKVVKEEFVSLFKKAKAEEDEQVKENADKIKEWCAALCAGKLSKDEFNSLLNAQKRKMEQFLLMKEIQSRARLEKITIAFIDFALNKVTKFII